MGDILTALQLGELMTEANLTWQATALFAVLIAGGIAMVAYIMAAVACLAAKAVKAWRDALR